jgi:uncharacterized protein YjbI with pentapeptide repeats
MKRFRPASSAAAAIAAAISTCVFAVAQNMGSVQGGTELSASQVRAESKTARAAGRTPNFTHAKILNQDLDGLDLHGANFRGANLLETSFRGANLAGANFDGAYMSAVKLAGANARGARLTGATLLTTAENVNLSGADLSNTSGYLIAPGGNLRGANFGGAHLSPEMSNQPMGLLHTILSGANLEGANLSNADFSNANFSGADLSGANLRGTQFVGADLSRVNFSGADLTGADVAKADLTDAHFVHVRGRAALRGLDAALNADRAVFR